MGLYETSGEDWFKELNGMFAFLLIDLKQQVSVVVRDRFGIKPLYYCVINGKIIFSSEIKPILSLDPNQKLNHKSIAHILLLGRLDHLPDTFNEGIKKLKHSHYVKIELKSNYSWKDI